MDARNIIVNISGIGRPVQIKINGVLPYDGVTPLSVEVQIPPAEVPAPSVDQQMGAISPIMTCTVPWPVLEDKGDGPQWLQSARAKATPTRYLQSRP